MYAAWHKIDVAVIDTSVDWVPELRKILGLLDVPYVYAATPLADGHVRLTGCDDDIFGALEGVTA